MTVEEMIRDVNSLPVQAQQQVADFIDFIKLKYPSERSGLPEKTPKLTAEDSFGMYSVDDVITFDDMDNGMAQTKPKSDISQLFGLFSVDKQITEDEIQEAIETMGGELDSP